jgi:hypothetical protein
MRPAGLFILGCVALTSIAAASRKAFEPAPAVTVLETPDQGIQPQALGDPSGVVHLVFFKGDPAGGDVYYSRLQVRNGAVKRLAADVRVNSIAGSALATGTVRGAQIALGRNGIVHVAWHGASPVVLYARSVDGAHFEAQRTLSGTITGIDGSTVAADRNGRVSIAWHGMGSRQGEGNRTVYLASSTNDGATFASPSPATTAPVGACGCCGLKAMFDGAGSLNILYRAATDGKHRDTTWLQVRDGTSRAPVRVDAGREIAAAWETAQQVYSAMLDPSTGAVRGLAAAPGSGSRKHPSIAVNAAGDRLLAWTEGTAWKRGGTFAWRLTTAAGSELGSSADAGPVPVWGLVSALAMPDGSFVIFR